jgi:adenine-specific DNA-methyltransferase
MAKSFNEKLIELLKTDSRFVDDEGELVKAAVIDRAWKIDRGLVKLLLGDSEIKRKFFDDIEGHWIFNINTFIEYIADKNFLANSYTRFRNKIGLNIDGKFLRERGEVSLVWPYKDCVLEGGQTKEEEKRKEIFFNEILAHDEIDRLFDPKVLTNWKRYMVDGEQKVTEIKRDDNGTIRENLIIKGNNLLALHSLKKQFRGNVKLIYIDPPYNTGKDSFGYNDNFNHSSWLTFMKNRLSVARDLLSNDGVIIVQSDDKEQAYLKILLDEVMGREQHETSFYVQVRYSKKTLSEDDDFQKVMEVAHIYSKYHNIFAPNKLKEEYSLEKFCYKITELKPGKKIEVGGKIVEIFQAGEYKIEEIEGNIDGLKETWATGSLIRQGGTAAEFLSKYLIDRKEDDGLNALYKVHNMGNDGIGYRYISGPRKKDAFRGKFYSGVPTKIRDSVAKGEYSREKPIPNLAYNYLQFEGEFGNCRNEGGVDIGGGKKPEMLLSFFIEYFSNEGDIVLDFFAGSGTTASVAMKMNRQFITSEQLDYTETLPLKRLITTIEGDQSGVSKQYNWKGGGDLIYCELMKYNEAFMDKIQAARTSEEVFEIWKEIAENSFLNWYVNPEMPEEAGIDFIEIGKAENGLEKQKKLLAELLNKNQLYVNLSEIDDADFNVSDEDSKLNQSFYGENA